MYCAFRSCFAAFCATLEPVVYCHARERSIQSNLTRHSVRVNRSNAGRLPSVNASVAAGSAVIIRLPSSRANLRVRLYPIDVILAAAAPLIALYLRDVELVSDGNWSIVASYS